MSVTARALAETRHLLMHDLDAATRSAEVLGGRGTAQIGAFMGAANCQGLHQADLFSIAPDACILATHAAPDLPETYRPPAEDLPAPAGMLAWEDPRTRVPDQFADTGSSLPVVAASWHVGPGSTGMVGILFTLHTTVAAVGKPFPGWRCPLVPIRVGSFPLGDGRPAEPWSAGDTDTDKAVRTLMTTWLLMHQGATQESPAPPERSRIARTLAKRGRPLAPVRVVDLHRGPAAPGSPSSDRSVSVRYAVRGHWRQQAYGPGRSSRRPVWIHPHVRGPEDAPWAEGTTVTRVRTPE